MQTKQRIFPRNPLAYGGSLRSTRKGRTARPLSFKHPIHLVLKIDKMAIHSGLRSFKKFQLVHHLLRKYSQYFSVRIEQVSIQNDHIHLLVRASHRSDYKDFFRVFSGQVAQKFQQLGLLRHVTDTLSNKVRSKKLWLHRPFTRIVNSKRAIATVRDYIQLNEQEAVGKIPYRKERLRGLTEEDRKNLWTTGDRYPQCRGEMSGQTGVTDTPDGGKKKRC